MHILFIDYILLKTTQAAKEFLVDCSHWNFTFSSAITRNAVNVLLEGFVVIHIIAALFVRDH